MADPHFFETDWSGQWRWAVGSLAVNPGCARAGNKQRGGQYRTHCELAAAVEKHGAIGDEKNDEDTDQREGTQDPEQRIRTFSVSAHWAAGFSCSLIVPE